MNTDTTGLVYLVIDNLMDPVDHTFPRVHFTSPTAEMSHAELEFRWEALKLATNWLPYGDGKIVHLMEEYWEELCKRVGGGMFGPLLAIEYFSPTDGEVHWSSVNMLMSLEVLRAAKTLESLEASNEFPVSSLTGAYVLLRGVSGMMSWCTPEDPKPTIARDLYTSHRTSPAPEHLVYCMQFLQICARWNKFIVVAVSRFLQQRQEIRSIQEKHYRGGIEFLIRQCRSQINHDEIEINRFRETFSRRFVNMASNIGVYIQQVTSQIAQLKAELTRPYYEEEENIYKIRVILGMAPQSLEYLLDNTGSPDAVIALLALQSPRENVYFQNSPYLALAADYHLLLLWRCMKPLSLLQWFMNRYGAVLENHGFTSEQVNGAMNEIASMAQYILGVFDAYEEAAGELDGQSRPSRLSDVERQQCLGVLGGNRLANSYNRAYNQVSQDFSDMHTCSMGNTGLDTGAQRNILDATTSTYSDPHDYTESRLGTRTRANFEGSSSPGGSQNKRNCYAGGRSDVGPSSGLGRRR
ncbi:hypothetical protein SeMB42_g07919 [Synchytrium endobioticum]|uniref:Uncharacterized protein n=1 Tax=Synchytrium endobioticum TaxID=286115 RepID=A0A507BRX2_9FUNG|nr:hypothetical protein SeMB42_g07919 [Synchytrium endobioticum]